MQERPGRSCPERAVARKSEHIEVEGRRIAVSNLDKVLYPGGSFRKGQVIDFYVRISRWLLPHLKGRPVTLKRFPDGVTGEFFYEKDAPAFTPEWVSVFPVARRRGGDPIRYVVIEDLATLVWSANLANLEIHPFLHRIDDVDRPTHVVFDLDPGEGADVLTCARVALLLRDLLAELGLQSFAKVSGSKGIQICVPLNGEVWYGLTRPFAKAIAQLMHARHGDLVVFEMAKTMRAGKVFIDWSQNDDYKTTVAVYSLRAKSAVPYVSLPVQWDELDDALDAGDGKRLYWTPERALARLERAGDLFEPVRTMRQELPAEVVQAVAKPRARKTSADALLVKYRDKRDFGKTPEPSSAAARASRQGSRRRFVVQKHAASHLHYDFRLEMHGVLKSWAVPKGPPYALDEARLARATEDHPLDYLEFEGIIPAGQYGGGTVMVWDIGSWQLIEGNYYKGFLHIHLQGRKLQGEWIVRRGEDRDSWRLIKAGRSMEALTAQEDDRSALSDRTMREIAAAADAVWHSNRSSSPSDDGARKPASGMSRKTSAGAAPERKALPDLASLPKAKIEFVEPMLARLGGRLPRGQGWTYELKLDGYRALAMRGRGKARLLSRRGNDLGRQFEAVHDAVQALPAGVIVDGEVVALDEDGFPSFAALQNAGNTDVPLYYFLFDVLAVGGRDVRKLPYRQRRELLESRVLPSLSEPVRLSATFDVDADTVLAAARREGMEGIVAKRTDSVYESGERSGAWIKYKTNQGQELVIGGFVPGRSGFESLLVGYHEGERLLFAAKIRNGFVPALRRKVAERFAPLATTKCPFANLPEKPGARRGEALTAEVMKKCRWLRPELVAMIEFTEWTRGNHLRHARFAGLRDDKNPREVVQEKAGSGTENAEKGSGTEKGVRY